MTRGNDCTCPNCRRSVDRQARLCRACYTVLPARGYASEYSSKESTRPGLHIFFAVIFVAGVAWYANLGESLYSHRTAATFSLDKSASNGLGTSSSDSLVVEVSDSKDCPKPGPCELHVRINGKKISYGFQRSEHQPDILTSRDPILVMHLARGGTASIEVEGSEGSTTIQLSKDNLVEEVRPGFISRWVGWIFNKQEGE